MIISIEQAFWIWFLGFVIILGFFGNKILKDGELRLSDILFYGLYSLFSWVAIVAIICETIVVKITNLRWENLDKVIWEKKTNKKHESRRTR